nr:hypothetical protein [Tanacetum cinerariifolium]
MSDSENFTITYTAVSSPFGEFFPEPIYPEFMPAEDDILLAEEQPLPVDDLEEDPADYPTDGGDEGDDKDESSDHDEDDDIDIEGDEYLAHANSTAITLPAIDHAPSAEETDPFEIDESAAIPPPHPVYHKRLCTAHTGKYELGESSAAAAARLREPVRNDLYRFVDTVERREGSTPAAMKVGYGITDTWDDLVGAIQETAPTTMEGVNQRGVAKALAACDADRNTNDDDSHVLGTVARRTERVTRECTYPDFMKCKPLNFKGTEGVVKLT